MSREIHKEKKDLVACLTGHRPKSLPWGYDETQDSCKRFKDICTKMFMGAINFGITTFLTGMAEGFDMIATELLLNLRDTSPHIKIVAVIPCLGQEKRWSTSQQNRYKNILTKVDKKIVLADYYTPTCMNERNMFMVKNADVCIACWNGKPSGTKNTILFAKATGCKVRLINPYQI